MALLALTPSLILLILDDWLRRERFIYIEWSGIVLFLCSYPCSGSGFAGTTFIIGYSLGLGSSTLEMDSKSNCLVPKEDCQPSMFRPWCLVFQATFLGISAGCSKQTCGFDNKINADRSIVIDSTVELGRGQRELIIGGQQTLICGPGPSALSMSGRCQALAKAIQDRKPSVDGLWTFVAFHGAFGLVILLSVLILLLSGHNLVGIWADLLRPSILSCIRNLSRIALLIRLDVVQGSDLWSCLSRLPQLDFESISKRCLKMVMALTTFLASDLELIGSRTSGVVELPAFIPLIAVSALGFESIANSISNPWTTKRIKAGSLLREFGSGTWNATKVQRPSTEGLRSWMAFAKAWQRPDICPWYRWIRIMMVTMED